MNMHNPDDIRWGVRKGAAALLFLAFISTPSQCFAADIHAEWSNHHIAALYPEPMDGWTIGELELAELKTITSGFESFVTGITSVGSGVSIRLQATRRYVAQGRVITILADTSDIETMASIDAIAAAYSADDALRGELEDTGVISISHRKYLGVSTQEDGGAALVFKVSSAGIVAMECGYPDCALDLASMMERLDLDGFTKFADFDHRK